MLFIEEENFLTEAEMQVIEKEILSNKFPWFYQQESTSSKFPFFSHVIVPRYNAEEGGEPTVNSEIYEFFMKILNRFRDKHYMDHTKIFRACLNTSLSETRYPHSDIHVDHHVSHKSVIIYLNDDYEGGDTLLFDRYYFDQLNVQYDLETTDLSQFNVMKRITPKKGKLVCFDGKIFHAAEWPKDNKRRVVCVITFE